VEEDLPLRQYAQPSVADWARVPVGMFRGGVLGLNANLDRESHAILEVSVIARVPADQ
jgi:hypothetical protein